MWFEWLMPFWVALFFVVVFVATEYAGRIADRLMAGPPPRQADPPSAGRQAPPETRAVLAEGAPAARSADAPAVEGRPPGEVGDGDRPPAPVRSNDPPRFPGSFILDLPVRQPARA